MLRLKRVEQILLFLTLLFLPTQLGRHFWPQFAYVYSLPIDYLSPIIYFWDLLVIFLWIIFLLSKQHINRLALNLYYFFLLTQSLSLLFNPGIGAGLVRLEQYLIAGLFGVYLASKKLTVKSTQFSFPLSLAVAGEGVLAILQFLKGGTLGFWILGERTFSLSTPAIAKFDFVGTQFLRPYGTFPHPNMLSAFMLIALLLPVGKWPTILGGLAILLTASRTAILAGFITAIILLRRWIFILVIILILSPVLFIRYSSIFNFDSLTLLRREELLQTAFSLWIKNPLLGVGLNNFIPQAANSLLMGPTRFLQPVHNIFLLALAETGILGLLGWLVLLGYPVVRLFKLYPRPYTSSSLSPSGLSLRVEGPRAEGLNPILLIWLIIFFLGLFDHYFFTLPQGYRLLFLVWGLSLSMLE